MDKDGVMEIFKITAKRLSENPDRFKNLIYPRDKRDLKRIREPELRHALTTVLSEKNIDFGLEVPTNEQYTFTGKSPDTANIDLVIQPNEEQVNIELKEGQPGRKWVQKDFEKLLRERVSGGAFYHILQNSNRRTVPTLLNKYKNAHKNIMDLKDVYPKWFMLFIFIKSKKEYLWKIFDDITNISEGDFSQDEYSKEGF